MIGPMVGPGHEDGAPWKPRAEILLTALLFSTGGAAIKATQLTSWQVASFRSGLAALALLVLVPAARRRWSPRVLVVALFYAATLVLFVLANKLTTAANTIFLQSTAPLYVLLLSPWLLGERVRRVDLVYMVLLAFGMGLFFVGIEPPQETAPDPFAGNVLGTLAGGSWAGTVMGLRYLSRAREGEPTPADGAMAAVAGNFLAFLVALPFALPVVESGASDWAVVAFLGIFQIGLAYAILTRAMREVPAFEASLLLLLEPVLNPLWAWLVHGEVPGSWALAGGGVILLTTGVKTFFDRRSRQGAGVAGGSDLDRHREPG